MLEWNYPTPRGITRILDRVIGVVAQREKLATHTRSNSIKPKGLGEQKILETISSLSLLPGQICSTQGQLKKAKVFFNYRYNKIDADRSVVCVSSVALSIGIERNVQIRVRLSLPHNEYHNDDDKDCDHY
jgi:hypothetical protein